jgi:hypothetical protein
MSAKHHLSEHLLVKAAAAAGVSLPTMRKFVSGQGSMYESTVDKINRALPAIGLERFTRTDLAISSRPRNRA